MQLLIADLQINTSMLTKTLGLGACFLENFLSSGCLLRNNARDLYTRKYDFYLHKIKFLLYKAISL